MRKLQDESPWEFFHLQDLGYGHIAIIQYLSAAVTVVNTAAIISAMVALTAPSANKVAYQQWNDWHD